MTHLLERFSIKLHTVPLVGGQQAPNKAFCLPVWTWPRGLPWAWCAGSGSLFDRQTRVKASLLLLSINPRAIHTIHHF